MIFSDLAADLIFLKYLIKVFVIIMETIVTHKKSVINILFYQKFCNCLKA